MGSTEQVSEKKMWRLLAAIDYEARRTHNLAVQKLILHDGDPDSYAQILDCFAQLAECLKGVEAAVVPEDEECGRGWCMGEGGECEPCHN